MKLRELSSLATAEVLKSLPVEADVAAVESISSAADEVVVSVLREAVLVMHASSSRTRTRLTGRDVIDVLNTHPTLPRIPLSPPPPRAVPIKASASWAVFRGEPLALPAVKKGEPATVVPAAKGLTQQEVGYLTSLAKCRTPHDVVSAMLRPKTQELVEAIGRSLVERVRAVAQQGTVTSDGRQQLLCMVATAECLYDEGPCSHVTQVLIALFLHTLLLLPTPLPWDHLARGAALLARSTLTQVSMHQEAKASISALAQLVADTRNAASVRYGAVVALMGCGRDVLKAVLVDTGVLREALEGMDTSPRRVDACHITLRHALVRAGALAGCAKLLSAAAGPAMVPYGGGDYALQPSSLHHTHPLDPALHQHGLLPVRPRPVVPVLPEKRRQLYEPIAIYLAEEYDEGEEVEEQ